MAGLYIHVPFCTKRCLYCDFFSNTEMIYKEPYVSAIIREIELRKSYLGNEPLQTIYFGGGTPSLLNAPDFDRIFNAIHILFDTSQCNEITLEVNPDDMTDKYVKSLCAFPFNRVSIGIQSFQQEDLHLLNRRHTPEQAKQAVYLCKENGLSNISIDLMYGLPGQTKEKWEANLNEALQLVVPHISAYHLTYEKGTALYKLLKSGKIEQVNEEVSVDLFTSLIERLHDAGYLHYEISNFARPGYISQHNSSYWSGNKYLGVGPSAHSYNGENREWNISSIAEYLKNVANDSPKVETEELDVRTRYNDFIITRLRTMWGIRFSDVQQLFGENMLQFCLKQAEPFIQKGFLIQRNDSISLSQDGIFISDSIMSDLLRV